MHIERIHFRAGKDGNSGALNFKAGKINLFIGPNNGGKSLALRTIQQFFRPFAGRPFSSAIISQLELSDITDEEVAEKMEFMRTERRVDEVVSEGSSVVQYRGFRQIVDEVELEKCLKSLDNQNSREYVATFILQHFILNLGGSERLGLAGAGGAQSVLEKPISTQAALFYDDEALEKLSNIVFKVFSKNLSINPVNLHNFTYCLTDEVCPKSLRRSLSKEAIEFFSKSIQVESLSDGTKAFIGMLAELISGRQDILFLDEPEAFLHPSLAYTLGREMALNIAADRQIFVATHSPHFLLGCLSSGVKLNVVRLTYDFGEPTARLLPDGALDVFSRDPLMRSVGMSTALFYSSVILLEGDSDRIFYDEANGILLRNGRGLVHSAFLNAHNKQTAAKACKPLRSIGIPAALILDIDWVKEDGVVARGYFESVGVPAGLISGFIDQRRHVRSLLEKSGENYKRNGGINALEESERSAASAFFHSMEAYGLFTVQGGELEAWLNDLQCSRSKASWIGEVLLKMQEVYVDTALPPEDEDVWGFLNRVAIWISDKNRLGMN